ncbi:hypothetical protein CRV24_003939 [Beauveria bassiana]|nr:hypothetical protein CRV24_003939 [Beauveria bassiana]KAH8710537.1 hypothetical protein HC256_007375 [Beauveria bassiana]
MYRRPAALTVGEFRLQLLPIQLTDFYSSVAESWWISDTCYQARLDSMQDQGLVVTVSAWNILHNISTPVLLLQLQYKPASSKARVPPTQFRSYTADSTLCFHAT